MLRLLKCFGQDLWVAVVQAKVFVFAAAFFQHYLQLKLKPILSPQEQEYNPHQQSHTQTKGTALMPRLTDLIAQAKGKDPDLGQELEREFKALTNRHTFGLNSEPTGPRA